MDRMERFFKMDQLLRSRRSVSRAQFLEALEVSAATFKRDLEYLRDRFGAPIEYDRSLNGYHYAEGSEFSLPGLWLNQGELHGLLTLQHLMSQLQPGLLEAQLTPLLERISGMLESGDHTLAELNRRVRLLSIAGREPDHESFGVISRALLGRHQLAIRYYHRGRNECVNRIVSPQRLVHYRDNWYLDAWCHLRDELRVFALECIRGAKMLSEAALEMDEADLDRELASGYGIFSGAMTQTAVLRFAPTTARWVRAEQWHPAQEGQEDDEGYYLLSFPYSDDRELVQDILRHGPNVEVLEPFSLRQRVITAVREIAALYGDQGGRERDSENCCRSCRYYVPPAKDQLDGPVTGVCFVDRDQRVYPMPGELAPGDVIRGPEEACDRFQRR